MEASTMPLDISSEKGARISVATEELWLSMIPAEFREVDLASCKELNPRLVEFALACVEIRPMISMYFFGDWGSGKTTLAFALIRHLMQTVAKEGYFWPNYISARDLHGRLTKAVREGYESYEFEIWTNCDLLFVDDLDKTTPTESWKMHLFEIFNKRMTNNLPSIITCNCIPEDLAHIIDGALASRIADKKKWEIIGFPKKDLRRSKIVQF